MNNNEVRAIERAFRRFSLKVNDHFGLFDSEVKVVLDDFSERVRAAISGDVVASRKLLAYLRHCLTSGKVPDKEVARWASRCLFEVMQHGVSADKAFSIRPETGRPAKGNGLLGALIVWECVEVIRQTQCVNKNKTEAIEIYQEGRERLAATLWKNSRERMHVESETTTTRLYRQGARIVKQFEAKTGQKPPPFSTTT